MQSAFVDLGLERDGFLYVSDVINTLEAFEGDEAADEVEGPSGARDAARRWERRRRSAGEGAPPESTADEMPGPRPPRCRGGRRTPRRLDRAAVPEPHIEDLVRRARTSSSRS